jgi:hypothetical protein
VRRAGCSTPEAGAVERRVVLVRRQAKHGEAGRVAVGVGDRRDAGDRRGHGVQVALLAGSHRVVLDRLLGAAEVGLRLVPVDARTRGDGARRVEQRHALELRVGDENLLIAVRRTSKRRGA